MSSVSDSVSNPSTSALGVRHTLAFDPSTTVEIDTVELTIHSPVDSPASIALYDAAGASLTSQNVWGTGTYTTNIASNVITISRNEGSAVPYAGVRSIVLDGMTNPSTLGVYYVTIATKAAGAYVDAVTTSFILSSSASIAVTVDPYFSFSVRENGAKDNASDDPLDINIELGGIVGVPSSHSSTGGGRDGHLLYVTTNAPNGYSITVRDAVNGLALNGGTVDASMRTLDDSSSPENQVIFDYEGTTAPAADTEAFFFTITGPRLAAGLMQFNSLLGATTKTIISSPGSVVDEFHQILYNAQIHPDTQVGTYADTITYSATPNF